MRAGTYSIPLARAWSLRNVRRASLRSPPRCCCLPSPKWRERARSLTRMQGNLTSGDSDSTWAATPHRRKEETIMTKHQSKSNVQKTTRIIELGTVVGPCVELSILAGQEELVSPEL